MNEMDAVINVCGYSLDHWPWTKRNKQRFIDSRVLPGLALASAIKESYRRPKVFIQASGVNHYGLRNTSPADESTPPAADFLADLTVQWEASTKSVEALGVRRAVARTAVVLTKRGGLFPLMALSVRLFFGGRFGDGKQSVPWIHVDDYVEAVKFLLQNEAAQGPFNLVAPQPTSNAEFMRAVAKALHRPYWFHVPAWLVRLPLGEMSVTLTEGSFCVPKHLQDLGYSFKNPTLENALSEIFQ
jgi:uncharacterized protein (TIGR01777 family)